MIAIPLRTNDVSTATADQWDWGFCPALTCAEDAFLVRARQIELWEIRGAIELPTWLMASSQPICPACASTLITASVKSSPDPH